MMSYFFLFPCREEVFCSRRGKLTPVWTNHSEHVWRRQDKEALLHALTSRPSPLYSRAIRCETIRRLISAERARPDKARRTWCAPGSINCFEDTRRSRERFARSDEWAACTCIHTHTYIHVHTLRDTMLCILCICCIVYMRTISRSFAVHREGTNVSLLFRFSLLSPWSNRKFNRQNDKKVLLHSLSSHEPRVRICL